MPTEGISSTNELALRQQLLILWEKMADQIGPLFLRRHVLVPELEKILRWRATHAALHSSEFAPEGKDDEQTFSHAAIITGLRRQEVSKAFDHSDASPVPIDGGELHRMIRILTAWRTEPGYQDEQGRPRVIPLHGPSPSFHQLCRRYGRDTPAGPIADAIVKNGNAEWINGTETTKRGKALLFKSAVVVAEKQTNAGMALLAQYASDFIHSLSLRIETPTEEGGPRFRQAYFNDIDPAHAEAARLALHEEIEAANRRFADCIAPFRLKEGRSGVRLGVCSYSFLSAPLLENDK